MAVGAQAGANQPPVADAGPDRYLGGSALVLDGAASYDPDEGDAIETYAWTQVSGPAISLVGAETAAPSVTASPLGVVQTVVLQLVVGDGEASSAPDEIKLTVVPAIPANIRLQLDNPPFDADKPTFVYFGGGNCNTGGGSWYSNSEWRARANIFSSPGYAPPYALCGDLLITLLSAAAPDYDRPVETAGFSTGGQPAIDAAIRINTAYQDARYAVNKVALLDGACRDYTESIRQFVENPVGDEPAWVENLYAANAGYANFRSRAVNIHFIGNHGTPISWYYSSIYPELFTSDIYNHGLVGGVFTSVLGHGGQYGVAGLPTSPYHFKWITDDEEGRGHLEAYNPAAYPGRLPQPVTLLGPADGQVISATGASLSCSSSENAVSYDLLLGPANDSLSLVATFETPPDFSTGYLPPETQYVWTFQVRDAFGTRFRTEPRSMLTTPGLKVDINGDGQPDATDCTLISAAFGTAWGNPSYHPAAEYNGDGEIDCADYFAWLADYRTFLEDPAAVDPCGLTLLPDSDGDGVPELCDRCAQTIPNIVVDAYGCPPPIPGDIDRDGDVDQEDFGRFQVCLTGGGMPQTDPSCQPCRLDMDSDVDQNDFGIFQRCVSGPNHPADPGCGHL
ncbi:MAG: hypothetical protein AMXMBFR13_03150 [Phycisphaerae bacterium]